MVAVWSSHLNPFDGKLIDISPGAIGNLKLTDLPKNFDNYKAFYNIEEGGDPSPGHKKNPIT